MLSNLLRIFSYFLMVSVLLVGCAFQKNITTGNTAGDNPGLNQSQPGQTSDHFKTEKTIAASPSQSGEVEQGVKPVKETGSAIKQTPVSRSEPGVENVSIALNVQFDTDKANIKPQYRNDIQKIADFMVKYPSTSAVIEGHTDNVGKEIVNVKLSYRRAARIKAYLADQFGIDGSRMKVIGYDFQKPIASNTTAEGRQKNRRGITNIETHGVQGSSYSLVEESDFPKGGFYIIDQELIDAKVKYYNEKLKDGSFPSKIVLGPTLELYALLNGLVSHCAIRIETNSHSFYQLELQNLPDIKNAGIKNFHKIGAAINLFGVTKVEFDVVEFPDKNEREKLDYSEPHYATMPICIDKKATKKTIQWYKDCLGRYARSYNPEYALRTGKPTKVFEYNPPTNNCCNFVEETLEACGLAHCFDLGKSSGLNNKDGRLEE